MSRRAQRRKAHGLGPIGQYGERLTPATHDDIIAYTDRQFAIQMLSEPPPEEADAIRDTARRLRRAVAMLYERAARLAFREYLIDRFDMDRAGLWHRISIVNDAGADIERAEDIGFEMTVALDGGGELVNAAKGNGPLSPVCWLHRNGRCVGEVATMDEVRALQARTEGAGA